MKYLSLKILALFLVAILVGGATSCKKEKTTTTTNQEPITDYTCSGTFVVGTYVLFNTNVPIVTATKILWDFGDGERGTSNSYNHKYMASGTYNTRLIVNDDSAHAITKTIIIYPNYTFTSTGISLVSDTVYFHFNYQPTGSNTYSWNFGDGHTATITDTVAWHIYTDSGHYNVTLNVNGDTGAVYNVSKIIRIFKDPLYTHLISGTRVWHGMLYTDIYGSNANSYSIVDSSFAIQYINPITILIDHKTYNYNPDSSYANVLFFKEAPYYYGDSQPGKVEFNYITDSISLYDRSDRYPAHYTGPGHPPPTTYQYYLSTP